MQTLYRHYAERYHAAEPQLEAAPAQALEMIITIPAHNEPDIRSTLAAIEKCELPDAAVEVIVCVNAGEDADAAKLRANQNCFEEVTQWAGQYSEPQRSYHVFNNNALPRKHAGVGLARKLVMDEAARRFALLDRPDGIIVGLDADSGVDANYLQAILRAFRLAPNMPAASIHYEHPIEGTAFAAEIYQAITEYELHLRAYVAGLRAAAYPYAFHTIGSSFAVRADVYCHAGGMNKRKAAEDFYFLQKLFPLGNYGEILDTRVIPSPRISDRVPFGTGKAVGDWLETDLALQTYDPRCYGHVAHFCSAVNTVLLSAERSAANFTVEPLLQQLQADELLWAFLQQSNFVAALHEMRRNSAGPAMLRKKLFDWFNNLRVLKCIHFARDAAYPLVSVSKCAAQLLELRAPDLMNGGLAAASLPELLKIFRVRQSQTPGWSSKF